MARNIVAGFERRVWIPHWMTITVTKIQLGVI